MNKEELEKFIQDGESKISDLKNAVSQARKSLRAFKKAAEKQRLDIIENDIRLQYKKLEAALSTLPFEVTSSLTKRKSGYYISIQFESTAREIWGKKMDTQEILKRYFDAYSTSATFCQTTYRVDLLDDTRL